MLRALLLLSTILFFSSCATNPAARQAAISLRGSLGEYQKALDDKIAEQQNFYAKREAAIAKAEAQSNNDEFEVSRRLRALEYASRLTADPSKQVRIDSILDFLQKSAQEDFEDYKKQRLSEATAEKEFDAAFEKLDRQSAAISAARKALEALATKDSRRQRLQAAAEFAKLLKGELAKQNQAATKK